MSTEPKIENDTERTVHTGIMNLPSALMMALWLLVILGFSGIAAFEMLSTPVVLGIILVAAVIVTGWSVLRFFKERNRNS